MEFFNTLCDAQTSGEIWAETESYFSKLGFDTVTYGVIRSDRGSVERIFSNMDPSFMRHYVREQYERIDPFPGWIVNQWQPFLYSRETTRTDHLKDPVRSVSLLDEVSEIGIRSSMLFPFRNERRDYAFGLNLGINGERDALTDLIGEEPDAVRLGAAVAQCFLPGMLSDADGLTFCYAPGPCRNPLSDREREVLFWLAEGYRNTDIAEKMDVVVATVNFHLNSIKTKLGTRTREQAIATALRRGIIK
ncbi:MAG: autoinducer binding domain-containing protein [Pseudomonadota bacterium]